MAIHAITDNTTCLGQRFIKCSCGVEVSGGRYDDVAERNFDTHKAAADRASRGKEILVKVREHAQANYGAGWDVVVEAWSDQDLAKEFHKYGIITAEAAIAHMDQIVDVVEDVRSDRTPIEGWHF